MVVAKTLGIALPRTKTADRMQLNINTIDCKHCRDVLQEMRDAVHEGEDTDGWWRSQFKQTFESASAGKHVHVQRP